MGSAGSGLAGAAFTGAELGCSKRAGDTSAFQSAREVAAVLPRHTPLQLVPPDIPGQGPIPDGYLAYPAQLVQAVREKPGSSAVPIKTLTPFWGPTPPGVG